MGSGPLDHPRLLEIEERLDRAEIDAAQRLLAELGDLNVHRVAITYFATRLLYQRGRLDAAGVVDRLRELVLLEPNFPQATAMLSAAENGTLRPDREGFLNATSDPAPLVGSRSAPASAKHSAPTRPAPGRGRPGEAPVLTLDSDDFQEIDTEHEQLSIEADLTPPVVPVRTKAEPRRTTSMPEIPRAPILPHFAVPENTTPSYAPGARSASLQFEFELELPEAPRDTIREPEPEPPPSSLNSAQQASKINADKAAVSAASTHSTEAPATVRDPNSVPPEALQRAPGPESMLERARVAWDHGGHERALADVERLEHAPLLDPELRAECARFLIEAGEPERAVLQARKAQQDDPNSALVQLMLAWGLVRTARRSPNHETIDEAESVLLHLRNKSGPIPALAQALRAAVLAEKGDAERAITTAQLALKLDPTAVDAEAAISLSCARLGRLDDARTAWERLHELSAEEAERMGDRLQQLGVTLRDASALPTRSANSAIRLWDKLEVELFYGDRAAAIAAFERGAARELRGLVGESATDAIPLLATMAAAFFTTEPVWRHFSPFDLSLGSIARVEAVLDVMYGRAPRDALTPEAYPAQVMLASYVGECLRQGYGGHWVGSLASPETVFVDANHTRFAPFHELRLRLEHGKPLLFEGAEGRNTRQSGAPIASPVTPPTPWDPAQWPSPRMLPRLGLAFSQSVVELYCAEFGGGPLDRSPVGLHSLDQYVALLAPRTARPAGGARWVERASVLIGAYLGEVLRDAVGASWRDLIGAPIGPESYTLLLPDGSATHPVTVAYDRLSGRTTDLLSHYAARLIDELS
ncbi:MAG TPA: tetratricopeptide repeat protein [Polyangiaceae bacterium]|nr:tetratricopeptide repeat protein [Polyangiaceae bacterium]